MGPTLRGRRVLVTGAARGLGAAAARELAGEGAACILLDSAEDELQGTVRTLELRGAGPFPALLCDLADRQSTLAAAKSAKEASDGDLGCLIHCAGVLRRSPVAEVDDRAWDETLAVNLTAGFLLLRALLPELRAGGGGSVVLTSSRAGVSGFAGESAYCASKFAVEGLAQAAAADLRADRVAVNTITPGARRIKPTGMSEAEEQRIPVSARGWGSAEDLGAAFCALALLPDDRFPEGGPTGRRFEADRVADTVHRRGLPLSEEVWAALAG